MILLGGYRIIFEVQVRRLIRIVLRCIVTVLVIFLALCTAGEIRQRILVHRAASLLSDMHSLRLHQSTWADAQRLMSRWGRAGSYDGRCTSQDCMYVITLRDLTAPALENNVAEWPSRTTVFLSAFRLLPRQWGGGLRIMQAMFLVQHGTVVRSGIWIDMAPSPIAKGAQPVCCGAELILSVRSQASLGAPRSWQEEDRSRHPDYTTWRPGGCTFCLMGRVTYADSMPSEDAAKLSNFQLSCATRWSSCLTLEELDPTAHAWHLYGPPWGDPLETTPLKKIPVGCAIPPYALGRDADRVVSVEALDDGQSLGKDAEGIEHESSRARVIAALKGDYSLTLNPFLTVVSSASEFHDVMRKPFHLAKKRHYLLLLGGEDVIDQGRVSPEACGLVQEEAASEQEVRRGVVMDDRLAGFEPSVSLAGFARHQPELWDR